MTASKLTPAQVRALKWLAERPGEFRYSHRSGHQWNVFLRLVALNLVERKAGEFRATPAGLALAKEVG